MTRYQFDRERLLTELSDFGIGFRKGAPFVPLSRFERFTRWVTGAAVGSAVIVALAVVFFWARYA